MSVCMGVFCVRVFLSDVRCVLYIVFDECESCI